LRIKNGTRKDEVVRRIVEIERVPITHNNVRASNGLFLLFKSDLIATLIKLGGDLIEKAQSGSDRAPKGAEAVWAAQTISV
jgi:hypothetical protein